MRLITLFLFSILLATHAHSQREKIKGNKIVDNEHFDIEGFHTLKIHEGFEVVLEKNIINQVTLEADTNILRVAQITVQDSILTIQTEKEIKRSKALKLSISYASELKKIIAHDKVNIKSLTAIESDELTIQTTDHAELFLTIDANKLICTSNGKSTPTLHATAKEIMYQVNDNAKLKGIATADSLNIDLYQKGSAALEGKVKSMLVRADNDTNFYGEKLTAEKVSLIAEGTSDCYLLVDQNLNIEAKDKSEIYLLGEPTITIKTFTNQTTLYKKNIDYTPSIFR